MSKFPKGLLGLSHFYGGTVKKHPVEHSNFEQCVFLNFLPGCSSSSLLKSYPVSCMLAISLFFCFASVLQFGFVYIDVMALVRRRHYRQASKRHLDIRAHLG